MSNQLQYKDYEKKVFNWLMAKHEKDEKFTFSVRQNGGEDSKLDYFIGTEKSKYFGTTFWTLPVSFPGSSSDCIDLIFFYTKTGYNYFFEFSQTKSPRNSQNESALKLLQSLMPVLKEKIGLQKEPTSKTKMFTFRTSTKKDNYESIEEMILDIDKDLEIILPIVDEHIEKEKKSNPDFEANRINKQVFDVLIERMNTRFERNLNALKVSSIDEMSGDDTKSISSDKLPLNQILFGPPGTGKTYNTINKALSIIENKDEEDIELEDRKVIKKRFDEYLKSGQIVFTTFHQSLSYEDFIEGIKPIIDENEEESKQVLYEVVDGLFKQIVEKAKKERTDTKGIVEEYVFEDAWNDLVEDAKSNLEKKSPLQLSIQTPNLGLKIVEITEKGNLKLKPIYSEQAKEYLVSFDRAKKLQNVYSDLSVVKNIDKEFRAVIGGSNSTAYWSVLNYINNRIDSNKKTIITEVKAEKVPHVLIIDEINRGNVSQIFGELITLIEESKRLGKEETLEVTLPYSKEKFGVPPNLYIIGTMNTADRSVEALDTALRRRFSFVEMMPNYEVLKDKNIEGISLATVLKTINNRVEVLLDRDHTIGHSYFINVNSLEELKETFKNNIIPLLQEYFYNDYGKIGLVLGKGFVQEKTINEAKITTSIFADFETKNEIDLVKTYELKPFNQVDFDNAIATLLA